MLVDANNVPEGAELAPLEGEGSSATPEASPAADSGDAAADVMVEAGEFFFEPAEFTIAADTDVGIQINNSGSLPHDFTILETDYAVDFEAGATGELTVNLPAGTYQVDCTIPGHAEQGMVATLIVE
jgi:uncharacterized cupredoxin-like copper-binding protein